MKNINRIKKLQWIDQKGQPKDDGIITGEKIVSVPKVPLAYLIPIDKTIAMKTDARHHHTTSQRDVTSCLRGTKLNKFQKQ